MDIYGDLTYSEGRSKYYGLPLEQAQKTLDVLQNKYDVNEAKWSELKSSIQASDFLDTEEQTIETELNAAKENMGSILNTDNFHLARHAVRKAVDGFATSKNVKEALAKKTKLYCICSRSR